MAADTNLVLTGISITVQPILNLQTIQQPTSACIPRRRAPITPEIPPDGISALQNSFRYYKVEGLLGAPIRRPASSRITSRSIENDNKRLTPRYIDRSVLKRNSRPEDL